MKTNKSTHLGDGAYMTIDFPYHGAFIITANHHDPEQATDVVHMDVASVQQMVNFLAHHEYKLKTTEVL